MTKQTPHQPPEQIKEALKKKTKFPVGTLAYYGPDDQTVTKITASVFTDADSASHSRRWASSNVAEDPGVVEEISSFFLAHNVQDVIMTDGIVGCPHVEGVDFPAGETCPHCSFWQTNP